MAHNGKTKLSDYGNTKALFPWEVEKIKRAIDKRLRRDKREEEKKDVDENASE